MENKYIIIILLAIIVILAAAIGVALFNTTNAKEASEIKITSDKEQYGDGELSIILTDLNRTPISKEIVNVTIKDKNGKVVVDDVVRTNSSGKANLDLNLEKGEYNVTVSYGGNENYTGTNATQNLEIKEEEVVENVQSQSTSSDSSSQNSEREEDQVTPDGWDPKEHEVSRESMDDGYERVNYDDGYMRIVDQDGNIVTYGFAG